MTEPERSRDPIQVALRKLLLAQDLTDTELMARADVSPATVSQYLSGRRGTRMNSQALKTVEKFAIALGVSPTYFLEYREALAHRMISEGMRAGTVDLEDMEKLVARRRRSRTTATVGEVAGSSPAELEDTMSGETNRG